MPPDFPPPGIDAASLSTPEAMRVAVLYLSAEVHRLREDFTSRGSLTEADRIRLAELVKQVEALDTRAQDLTRAMEAQNDNWFDRIAGQGDEIDKSRRPLLRLFVLAFAVVVAIAVIAVPVWWFWYTSAQQEARRAERERRVYVLDSLERVVPRVAAEAQAAAATAEEAAAKADSAAVVLDSLVGDH